MTGSGSSATSTFTISTLTAVNHHIVAVYSATGNFAGSSDSVDQTVTQATPTIAWTNPAAITYGTELSGTQLDAIATNPESEVSVAGTFTYTPSSGTVLGAGNDRPSR